MSTSKTSMRARKLDHTKPLKVYKAEDLPDLEDQSQYGRGIVQIATGVEKEEEEVFLSYFLFLFFLFFIFYFLFLFFIFIFLFLFIFIIFNLSFI